MPLPLRINHVLFNLYALFIVSWSNLGFPCNICPMETANGMHNNIYLLIHFYDLPSNENHALLENANNILNMNETFFKYLSNLVLIHPIDHTSLAPSHAISCISQSPLLLFLTHYYISI